MFFGRDVEFAFKGTFENGAAVVNLTVLKKDGTVNVTGFYIKAQTRPGTEKLTT